MKRVYEEDNYEEHLEVNTDQIQPPKQEGTLRAFAVSELGEIMREIREKEHLTVEELAQKCGTTPEFISDIENEEKDIDLNQLSKIVRQGLDGRLELILRL